MGNYFLVVYFPSDLRNIKVKGAYMEAQKHDKIWNNLSSPIRVVGQSRCWIHCSLTNEQVSITCCINGFNTVVLKRVTEHEDEFMFASAISYKVLLLRLKRHTAYTSAPTKPPDRRRWAASFVEGSDPYPSSTTAGLL